MNDRAGQNRFRKWQLALRKSNKVGKDVMGSELQCSTVLTRRVISSSESRVE
jgi:hypothetical protein